MRTPLLLTALASAALFSACGKQDNSSTGGSVPEAVVRSFQATHPEVKDASWQMDEEGFEAEWKVNGMERGITYNEKGEVLITEEQVPEAEMPAAIAPYLTENHAGLRIMKVGKELQDGTTTFEVELDNSRQELELIFDAEGNFLGEEGDDQDSEEDHD